MAGLDAVTMLAILVFGPGYLILLWYCMKGCFLFTKGSIVSILQRLRRKMSPIQVHHVDSEDTPPPGWAATTLTTTSAGLGGPNTDLEGRPAPRAATPLTISSAGYFGDPSYSNLEDVPAPRPATTTISTGYFGGPYNSGRFANGRRIAVVLEFPGGLPVREYIGR